jgi:uncharacterized protein with PQ loop repeat
LSWSLTALSCGSWLLYGLRTGETPQIPGNVLIVSGALVIVLAVPSATTAAARGARLAGAAVIIVALATVLPPEPIGVLAIGIGLVSALPQIIKSFTRGGQDASAVSLSAWLLRATSQVCWLFYAVVRHDWTVTVSTACILTSAVLLITAELRPRRAEAVGARRSGAGDDPHADGPARRVLSRAR